MSTFQKKNASNKLRRLYVLMFKKIIIFGLEYIAVLQIQLFLKCHNFRSILCIDKKLRTVMYFKYFTMSFDKHEFFSHLNSKYRSADINTFVVHRVIYCSVKNIQNTHRVKNATKIIIICKLVEKVCFQRPRNLFSDG